MPPPARTAPHLAPRITRRVPRGTVTAVWVALATFGTGAAISTLWLVRPRWTTCVAGVVEGGCVSGVSSVTAMAAAVALMTVLAAIVLIAAFVRGGMRLPLLVAATAAGVVVFATGLLASIG